jgi:hypothetical protein
MSGIMAHANAPHFKMNEISESLNKNWKMKTTEKRKTKATAKTSGKTKTTTKASLADIVVSGIKTAAGELEQFKVKAALGKMELKDLFEESKKKLLIKAADASVMFDKLKDVAGKKVLPLKSRLEELQLQLALGKAEGKQAFEKQRKKLDHLASEIETMIRENPTTARTYNKLMLEIKKFKIKMDILRLRYERKKRGQDVNLDEVRGGLYDKLASARLRLEETEKFAEKKWKKFSSEMQMAYGHLKAAFEPVSE